MARRRRSLLGTPRTPLHATHVPDGVDAGDPPRSPADDEAPDDATSVEASPSEGDPAPPEAAPEQAAEPVDDAPDGADAAALVAEALAEDAPAREDSEAPEAVGEPAVAEAEAEAADAEPEAEAEAEAAAEAEAEADEAPADAAAEAAAAESRADVPEAEAAAAPEGASSDTPDWERWRTVGMEAALREIGGEDFDDLGDRPPTEEVSSALFEDYTTPFDGSVHVPEPPPIPGLGDRFTPPPVQRTPVGKHQTQNRPSYLAEPTPSPAPQRDRGFTTYEEELRKLREADAPPDPGMSLGLRVLAGFMIVGCVSGALGFWSMLGSGTDGSATFDGEGIPRKHVEVRGDLRQTPGFIGVGPEALREPIDDDPQAEAATEAPPEGTAAPTPQPASAAAPKAAASPPAAERKRPKPEAVNGTLRIRSNRRVLVYLNDRAVGYTPQDLAVAPGAHRVSAMLPGQPETRQELEVHLSKAGDTEPVDFRF